MQTGIPCTLMRGGTSKGTYFLADDLPSDKQLLQDVLLAVMGSPDPRQINGVGGAHPLTSKVAIIKPSTRQGIDLDYLFVQVVVDEANTSTKQNCGNILAGIAAFGLEKGLVKAQDGETTVSIFMENTESVANLTVKTPDGHVSYDGDTSIDGVPGSAAPVMIEFVGVAGSSCGALLPTGNPVDEIDGIACTLIDNGMPVVVMTAESLGVTGHESIKDLEANSELKQQVEAIRLKAGHLMNLGDIADKTVPKMALVSKSKNSHMINTRCFIPHRVHESVGVLAAVSIATAGAIPGSTAEPLSKVPAGNPQICDVEHPTGVFTVAIDQSAGDGSADSMKVSVVRTSRMLFDGNVFIPAQLWDGN